MNIKQLQMLLIVNFQSHRLLLWLLYSEVGYTSALWHSYNLSVVVDRSHSLMILCCSTVKIRNWRGTRNNWHRRAIRWRKWWLLVVNKHHHHPAGPTSHHLLRIHQLWCYHRRIWTDTTHRTSRHSPEGKRIPAELESSAKCLFWCTSFCLFQF